MTTADSPINADFFQQASRVSSLWQVYTQVYTGLNTYLDKALRSEAKLKFDDFQVLHVLSEGNVEQRSTRPVRMGEIAQALNTSPSRLTYQVDRMIGRGWVERTEVEEDRRGRGVIITPDGYKRFCEGFRVQFETLNHLIFNVVSPQELKTMNHIMSRLLKNIQAN